MFISDKIVKLINKRIKEEEESSRLYLATSVCLENDGFLGTAKLFKKYSEEEQAHADKAYRYLLDLSIKPTVPALAKQQEEFEGIPQVVKMAVDHEMDITESCNELAKAAQEEGDYMTLALAQWYLTEQVEEIGKVTTLADQLEAFGTDKIALRLFDNNLL